MLGMRQSLLLLILMTPLLATARPALARRTVSVLAFGGPTAKRARAKIVNGLRRRYKVLGANSMPQACDDLGIAMTKGRNLARCAKHIGAVAVVGGKVVGRSLTLVVFSGKTGQVLRSVRTRWSRRPKRKMVRRALRALHRGLAKAPRRVGRRRAPRAPEPRAPEPRAPEPRAPEPRAPQPQPLPEDESGLSFNPDAIDGNTSPDGGDKLPPDDGPENPLAPNKLDPKPPTDEPTAQPRTKTKGKGKTAS